MFKKNINQTQEMAFRIKTNLFSILWEEIQVIFGRTINVLLITNPILFPIWCLCAPKEMGSFLSEGRFWRTRVGALMKKLSIWEAEHFLPTGRRLAFIKNVCPDCVSVKNQLLFFQNLQNIGAEWKMCEFSPEAQKLIWEKYHKNNDNLAFKMLADGYTLNESEQIALIKEDAVQILEKYSQNRTLSTRVLKELYHSKTHRKTVFFEQIAKNGASPELMAIIENEDEGKLLTALQEFSQVALVKATKEESSENRNLFFKLAKSEKLCLRAQKEITLWQYRDMKTLGKSLYPEVILLKANPSKNQDWQEWVKLFIRYEDLSFPEWERSLLNNIQVRMFVMQNPALAVGKL